VKQRRSNRHARERRAAHSRGQHRDPLEELRLVQLGIGELLDGRVHKRDVTLHHLAAYDALLTGFDWCPDKLLPRNGWVIDFRPGIHVREQVIVPDLAGWRTSRRVQPVSDEPFCNRSTRRFTDGPDWICDIVEPTNVGLVRKIKMPIYHRLGVASLWLVDRIESTLEVYSAGAVDWQLDGAFEGNGLIRAVPLKHVEIHLGGLWEPR
jgi:hypothetical protein